MSSLELLGAAATCLTRLQEAGFKVNQMTDFDRVSDLVAELGKPYLTPVNNPCLNDFTPRNAFWNVLTKEGKPAGCMAIRMDDLGSETLDRFWRRNFRRHYPMNAPEAVVEVNPIVQRLGGKVAYVGDLYVAPEHRGSRSILQDWGALTHYVISVEMAPDWTYSFVHENDARRGAMTIYHYLRSLPRAFSWAIEPHGRSAQERLLYMDREEQIYAIQNAGLSQ